MLELAATTFVVYCAVVLPVTFLFWLAFRDPEARRAEELRGGYDLSPSRTPILDFLGVYLVVLTFVIIAN